MEPPNDPMGTPCLCADLTVDEARIIEILEQGLHKTLTWIMAEN